MTKFTSTYNFAKFVDALDTYNAAYEEQRWDTLDLNLSALFSLLGNGVLSGWIPTNTAGRTVSVSAGKGIIAGIAAFTSASTNITVPADVTADYQYIMWQKDSDTYYTGSPTLAINTDGNIPSDAIPIAKFKSDSSKVTELIDVRVTVGMTNDILSAIQGHTHTGTSGQPSKIDLSSQVSGVLSPDNIGDIDAAKITGKISAERLSAIAHEALMHVGRYTHAQLDDWYNKLTSDPYQHFGAISIANRLQIALSLLHLIGTDATKYLINEKEIIPGITPATDIDTTFTTATVNTTDHTVSGVTAESLPPVPGDKTWDKVDGDGGFSTTTSSGNGKIDSQNIKIESTPGGGAQFGLALISETKVYYSEGYTIFRFDAAASVEWISLAFSATIPTGTSIQVAVRSGSDTTTIEKLGFTGLVAASPIILSNIPHGRVIDVKFTLKSNTAKSATPTLDSVTLTYDNTLGTQCSFLTYTSQPEWETEAEVRTANIDTTSIAGDVLLSRSTIYANSGKMTSKVIDGTANFASWGYLWISQKHAAQGSSGDISIEYRSSSTSFAADASTPLWTQAGTDARIDLTSVKNRYLQLRITLNRNASTGTSPDLLDIELSYLAKNDTTIKRFKKWTDTSTGDDGFLASTATINNIDTTSYDGAICIADPANGRGVWESPPFAAPASAHETWSQWDSISIVGENLPNAEIMVYFSSSPSSEGWTAGWSSAKTADVLGTYTIDLTSGLVDSSLNQKRWIKVRATLAAI